VELLNKTGGQQKEDILAFVEENFERRFSEEVGKLQVDMHQLRADLIKWMFIFWNGQIGAILGILFAFFK